jgi:flagellar basal body-associated protein FliL
VRSIWSILAILAVAHLLAFAGALAWLVTSGRLDTHRVETIRAMLSETIADEQARLKKEADANEQAKADAAEALAETTLPLGAADRVQVKLELSEIDRQQILRRQREAKDLQINLIRERQVLDQDIAAFNKEKADFEAWRQSLLDIEGTDQFKKTLATYEGLKPKEAKESLASLLAAGQKDQVVTYLSAMDERQRVKIIAEFNKEDPSVAADLLEALRTRGTVRRASGATAP